LPGFPRSQRHQITEHYPSFVSRWVVFSTYSVNVFLILGPVPYLGNMRRTVLIKSRPLFKVMNFRTRPRVCENPKLETSNGNCSLYFLNLEPDVGFLYPDKQVDGSFVRCRPKNNDRQIVFTQPRPTGDIRIRERIKSRQRLTHINSFCLCAEFANMLVLGRG
jgi:hypothetical protein